MRLIFDCGSTKSTVAILDDDISGLCSIQLAHGHNALSAPDGHLIDLVHRSEKLIEISHLVAQIYFYGAGCATDKACTRVVNELQSIFPKVSVDVNSDMLGAARGLCGDRSGIVCILGTGSNSCVFDGERIVENMSPLGYILGDEGSGAVLGRLFLGRLFKGRFSNEIRSEFNSTYHLSVTDIIERVYRSERPNAFLASFAPFLASHSHIPEIESFLIDEFRRFIAYNLGSYKCFPEYPVHFAGSIAHYFRPLIAKALELEGGVIGNVVREPMAGLVDYHMRKGKSKRKEI